MPSSRERGIDREREEKEKGREREEKEKGREREEKEIGREREEWEEIQRENNQRFETKEELKNYTFEILKK